MLLYLPIFALLAGTTLARAPWRDIVLQASFGHVTFIPAFCAKISAAKAGLFFE
jgi:hypothetical protein